MVRTLSIACAVLLAAATAWAQTGRVAGRVTDQTGGVLPGVIVNLASARGERTATTDATGSFAVDQVQPGPAELTFRLINFTVLRRSVVVAEGQVTPASAVMTLALSADVVVTGTRTFRNVADIENPAENLVGIAASSSQGAVTAAQLETRPIMRAGEVLETVAGLVISQHSGEGKANQAFR